MKKFLKKLLKNKRLLIFLILFIILCVCIFVLRGVFITGGGSKYGNRLDGIKKISFTEKDQKSITNFVKKFEKVESAKMKVHGKIINVIFDMTEESNTEEAHQIAAATLDKFSKEVKGFYDIEFIITKSKEKGTEVQKTNDDGSTTTTIKKEFPIMGYKNSNRDNIVW